MRFGPPEAFMSDLHPPPSFWSTSASTQAPTAFLDDAPPHARQATSLKANLEGTACASTVCSALRGRQKLIASSPGKAVCDSAASGRLRSGRSAGRRRRRPACGAVGCSPRLPQSPSGGGDVSASAPAAKDVSYGHGRFSPRAAVPPPKPTDCWGGGSPSRPCEPSPPPSPPPPPPPPSSCPSPREPRGRRDGASDNSPTRIPRWGACGSETEGHDLPEEQGERARAMSPGRKEAQARRSGLIDAVSPRSRSSVSPRRGTVIGGGAREGAEVAGFAFLEIQRDLLKHLESLFVSIADDRRHALVALKREENEWKASAMERARSDIRAATPAATDGAADAACSSGSGGGVAERMRENVVEGGPGATARKAVGLVKVGGGDDDGRYDDIGADNRLRLTGSGGGRGPREEWSLPKTMVEAMRKEFAARMDHEIAEVLEQENKALLEERAEVAAREGTRTKRELRELSDRLTNDGRDALASLRMELEAAEEIRLVEERGRLREALACSLQRERERLITERKLAVFDIRDASGHESSRLAASLWEQAERSTSARRAEAVRLLDQAAERARVQLDALLEAQEQRGLEDVRQSGSAKRKAAIKRAREEGERRCLEELKALAEAASKKNDAWLRMVLRDLRQALDKGGNAVGSVAKAGGGGEEEGDGGTGVAPALQLRAVEASEDCARLGRRLVELIVKEALMRLRESGFDVTSQDDDRLESGVQATATCSTRNSDGAGSVGRRGPGRDQGVPARISENCGVSEGCRDCERLARANVELSRLMRQKTASSATSSPARRAPTTIGVREEARSAAPTMNGGRVAAAEKPKSGYSTVAIAIAGEEKKAEGGRGRGSSGSTRMARRVKT